MERNLRSIFVSTCIATSVLMTPVPSFAGKVSNLEAQTEGLVRDRGAADRVEAGKRLRTLTQRMASSACHIHAGIDVEVSEQSIISGFQEFEVLTNAIVNGDKNLNILGAENNAGTLQKVNSLQDGWKKVRPALEALLADASDQTALSTVYSEADALLDASVVLTTALEAQYANPVELMGSDALLIEVSGSQAMALQRLSYKACRIWSGYGNEDDLEEVKKYVSQFNFVVQGLLKGVPEIGVEAAPTQDIAAKLTQAAEGWDEVSGTLASLANKEEFQVEDALWLCQMLQQKTAAMEGVMDLYTDYSRRVY